MGGQPTWLATTSLMGSAAPVAAGSVNVRMVPLALMLLLVALREPSETWYVLPKPKFLPLTVIVVPVPI